MRDARPGDQVIVLQGTFLRAVIGNEESYNDRIVLAVVVSTSCRVVEADDDVNGCVTVFIADRGLFLVDESMLLTPDEYGDPARLFPPIRLREP